MAMVICLLTGCQLFQTSPSSKNIASQSTRNNCYSLLHQLLNDEKDVSMLRFIKREQPEVKILIGKIAKHSADGSKLLEEFAKHDPSIVLEDIRLPSGEMATRDSIASTKKKELLGQSGDEFELSLLLAQAEALSYASHLAEVAGKNETQPDRARALKVLSDDMSNLYHEVFVMLLSKSRSTAAK